MKNELELRAAGLDTVRYSLELNEPLPLHDGGYRREVAASGWNLMHRESISADGEPLDSRTMHWQDPENSTLRVMAYNAGRSLAVEFSAARLVAATTANLALATPDQVRDLTHDIKVKLAGILPDDGFGLLASDPLYRRLDYAADVAAFDARPGLISASSGFQIPNARKVTRQVFPGETSRASSSKLTFRSYDKAKELEHKLRDEVKDGSQTAMKMIEDYKASGVVRLELQNSKVPFDGLQTANIKWSETVERGFSGGCITIGGLDYIRSVVDGNAELSAQTRNSLIAFAVRYAELGEDGMMAAYKRATFYRQKKKFLEAGLRLEDICTYSGEIDLKPILRIVKGA